MASALRIHAGMTRLVHGLLPAAVLSILLDRLLKGEEEPISASDLAELTAQDTDEVRGALLELKSRGVLSLSMDAGEAYRLRPESLRLQVKAWPAGEDDDQAALDFQAPAVGERVDRRRCGTERRRDGHASTVAQIGERFSLDVRKPDGSPLLFRDDFLTPEEAWLHSDQALGEDAPVSANGKPEARLC